MKGVHLTRLENMRFLIEQYGSVSKFAEAIDREPSMISRCAGKNPRRTIGSDLSRHIENALLLEVGWLDWKHAAQQGNAAITQPTSGVAISLPILSLQQVATLKQGAEWPDVEQRVNVPGSLGLSQQAFACCLDSDTMISPNGKGIIRGSTVVFDTALVPASGKIVIARNQAQAVTIRQLVLDAGQRLLVPINSRYPIIHADDDWSIIGVARFVQLDL